MCQLHRTPLTAVPLKSASLAIKVPNKPKKCACFAFCQFRDGNSSTSALPQAVSPPGRMSLSSFPTCCLLLVIICFLWEARCLQSASVRPLLEQTHRTVSWSLRGATARALGLPRVSGAVSGLCLALPWAPSHSSSMSGCGQMRTVANWNETGAVGTLFP